MKFTQSWLRQHLRTEASLSEITDALTDVGLELEGVEDPGAALAPFTVAAVVEATQHPDADRLRVCTVRSAAGEHQVVCGAPNARAGMHGIFAPPGSHVPGTGLDLKVGKIRGVESHGMLLSARELGISDEHDGIVDLPTDIPVGTPAAEALGMTERMIDIAITPNRADCLGVRGVARDLAAKGLGSLTPLDTAAVPGQFDSPIGVRLALPAGKQDACPLFMGRYFKGVKNGESPVWLKHRLEAIGLRPISTLVDITNLVTFDLGRPLHVFDADKLDRSIVVRLAEDGETIAALDNKTYTLDPEMTVVADESKGLGLGGIIGGEESGCTADTVNVFLEVALFDPIRTATTGRKLGIVSDARYRFERGLDPAFAPDGMEIATRLILELCGGTPSHVVSAGAVPEWRRAIAFRPARVAELGGVAVPEAEQRRILEVLGFTISGSGDSLTVTPPSWRADIVGEADLVEEVLRIHGFDKIPAVSLPPRAEGGAATRDLLQRRTNELRRALAARGLSEAVTFSFMSSSQTALFGADPASQALRLMNPISADLDEMRPSILPNLINGAQHNADRGRGDIALFEIGPQFAHSSPDGQTLAASGIRMGQTGPKHWRDGARPVDAFDAKADAVAALTVLGAPVDGLQTTADAPSWYHPGRSGCLRLGPKVLAQFGEIHPGVLKALDVKGPVVGFEVFPAMVPTPKAGKGGKGASQAASKARPALDLAAFQPVTRDFAFVVDADVPAEKLLRAAKGAAKDLEAEVALFDVYQGDNVAAGQKSLAVTVTLQPREKTLTDAEIEAVVARVVAAVEKQTGGVLRG